MKQLALSLSFSLIVLTLSACNDQNTDSTPASEATATEQSSTKTSIATEIVSSTNEEKTSNKEEKVESQVKKADDTESAEPADLSIKSTEAIEELASSIDDVVQDSIQDAVSTAVGNEVEKKSDR
jgi:hypothetical protein